MIQNWAVLVCGESFLFMSENRRKYLFYQGMQEFRNPGALV